MALTLYDAAVMCPRSVAERLAIVSHHSSLIVCVLFPEEGLHRLVNKVAIICWLAYTTCLFVWWLAVGRASYSRSKYDNCDNYKELCISPFTGK